MNEENKLIAKKGPAGKTAKNELAEQIITQMTPLAAKIFREVRKEQNSSGDWIIYASQRVVKEITERMFAALHIR